MLVRFPTTVRAFARGLSTAGPTQLKFLVVDGYAKSGRDDLQAGGASTAGVLYDIMLAKSCPAGIIARSQVIYPGDPGFKFSDYDFDSYSGVAWTGSSLTVYSGTPAVTAQIDLCKALFEKQVPMFGSCWALQLAAVAAGGKCAPNPRGREMGLARKIVLTSEGRGHPMYVGKPSVFDAFTSHEDEVTHIPAAACVLAGNEYTRIQAMSVTHKGGVCWGIQYHPEYDLHELARLTFCRTDKLVKLGMFRNAAECHAYVDDLEALHKDPLRKDISWRLGFDGDVMNEDVRLCEVRNWVSQLVVPFHAAKRL